MNKLQIESWAMQIIESVEKNQPNEDSLVELKRKWIEPEKAARQLAGHSNAARGEPILWIIGVDQKEGIIGADVEELANWFPAVQSEFDGIAPSLLDLNMPLNDKTVVLLYFETDRAPFVINNPLFGKQKGSIKREVPWREGTSTRSATRSDLLKLLIPVISLPQIEVLGGHFYISLQNEKWQCYLSLDSYITPNPGHHCLIPFHKCDASFIIDGESENIVFSDIKILPPHKTTPGSFSGGGYMTEPDSMTVSNTDNEVIISGPGRMKVICENWIQPQKIKLEKKKISIKISLNPVHTVGNLSITEDLNWTISDRNSLGEWVLG